MVEFGESLVRWLAGHCFKAGTAGGVFTSDSRTADILAVITSKQKYLIQEKHQK